MRVSDIERQRAIDELRRHCAAGRLNVDEYAARIEKAMSATTLEELDGLRADLPMIRIADPSGAQGSLPAARGEQGVRQTVSSTAVAVLTVIVILGALILALAAEWTWSVVLIVGWLIGMLQGRIGRWRSRSE